MDASGYQYNNYLETARTFPQSEPAKRRRILPGDNTMPYEAQHHPAIPILDRIHTTVTNSAICRGEQNTCFVAQRNLNACAALMDAIIDVNLAHAQLLIERNPDIVNAVYPNGTTPLALAVSSDNFTMTHLLLDNGAHISSLTPKNLLHLLTIIDAECFAKHQEAIRKHMRTADPLDQQEKNRLIQCEHILNILESAANTTIPPHTEAAVHANRTILRATTVEHTRNIETTLAGWSLKTKAYKKLCQNQNFTFPPEIKRTILAMRAQEKRASKAFVTLTKQEYMHSCVLLGSTNIRGDLEGFAIAQTSTERVKIKALVAKPLEHPHDTCTAQVTVLTNLKNFIIEQASLSGIEIIHLPVIKQ